VIDLGGSDLLSTAGYVSGVPARLKPEEARQPTRRLPGALSSSWHSSTSGTLWTLVSNSPSP